MLEGETTIKAPLPLQMDLDLRLEAWNEGGLQQAEANESFKLLSLDLERAYAKVRIRTKMPPPMRDALKDLLVETLMCSLGAIRTCLE